MRRLTMTLGEAHQGREIGVRLNALLDAVIDNRVENEKSALLRWLKDAP